MSQSAQPRDTVAVCTVYFDGACPLCSREIAHYQRVAGAAPLSWVDASRCESAELPDGLNRQSALAKLHVRNERGALVVGAAAFAEIWTHIPKYAWLGRVASRPWISAALELGYDAFLWLRRLWRKP